MRAGRVRNECAGPLRRGTGGLVVAQGTRQLERRRAMRRQKSGRERHDADGCGAPYQDQRITWAHVEHVAADEVADPPRDTEPESDPNHAGPRPLSENAAEHLRARGAERLSDGQFTRPLRDDIRNHPEHPDRGERQCRRAKPRHQPHAQALPLERPGDDRRHRHGIDRQPRLDTAQGGDELIEMALRRAVGGGDDDGRADREELRERHVEHGFGRTSQVGGT